MSTQRAAIERLEKAWKAWNGNARDGDAIDELGTAIREVVAIGEPTPMTDAEINKYRAKYTQPYNTKVARGRRWMRDLQAEKAAAHDPIVTHLNMDPDASPETKVAVRDIVRAAHDFIPADRPQAVTPDLDADLTKAVMAWLVSVNGTIHIPVYAEVTASLVYRIKEVLTRPQATTPTPDQPRT